MQNNKINKLSSSLILYKHLKREDNSYSSLQTQMDFQLFFHADDKQPEICLCSQATHTETIEKRQITWIGLSVRTQHSKKCHPVVWDKYMHSPSGQSSNFSLALALWEGIRQVGLSTKSLKQQTKTCPGQARCQSYSVCAPRSIASPGGCTLISTVL